VITGWKNSGLEDLQPLTHREVSMTAAYGQIFSRTTMRESCCWWMVCLTVLVLCCLLPPRLEAVVQTEDLIFTAGPQQMIFTIPTRQPVPEIHPYFIESADHVVLSLPDIEPDFPALVYQSFDDEWVSGYGLKHRDNKFYWQFEKRQESIPLKKYLSVQTAGRRIIVSIMKPYRAVSLNSTPETHPDQSITEAEKLTDSSAKMARINALLAGEDSLKKIEKVAAPKSAGLLYPGMRIFASLAALIALILISYRPVKKILQKAGKVQDDSLVRIIQTVPIGMKRQIMFLDVADEVLVVGLSGDQMTMLTRITEPERLESLRLLHSPESGKKSFISSLRSFSSSKLNSRETAAEPQAGQENTGMAQQDPYGEVVAQIKQRLQGLNRLQ